MMQSFKDSLLHEVLLNLRNNHQDNYDEVQCGKQQIQKQSLLTNFFDKRLPLNSNLNNPRKLINAVFPKAFYKNVIAGLDDPTQLFELLNDESSKKLLLKLYAYRMLGHKKVKLPRNNPQYWQDIKRAETFDVGHDSMTVDFMNLTLPLLDLAPLGYNIKLNAHPVGAACIYMQRQYEYHGANIQCKAEPGDIVLDGGACWGDSALYFSHEVGPDGKVFAFEFVPKNLMVLNKNLKQNSHISTNVEIIEQPMWHRSYEQLYVAEHGPGSSVHYSKPVDQPNSSIYKTLSIDDLVDRHNLRSVDFIKMDIEGSELSALRGAEKTLKYFKPKLAISMYHKPDDFVTIPAYLHGLNLDYDYYLDHHTIHAFETVLFAIPKKHPMS